MAGNAAAALAETKWKLPPIYVFFKDAKHVFKMDDLGKEILEIAVPAALALAADPIASLIDTAFIGHIGPVELAAVGVSIAIFNQASRITIFPLVSITTSFVAEEETAGKLAAAASNKLLASSDDEEEDEDDLEKGSSTSGTAAPPRDDDDDDDDDAAAVKIEKNNRPLDEKSPINSNKITGAASTKSLSDGKSTSSDGDEKKRRHIPSASTAIVLGMFLGLFQAVLLVFGSEILLTFMGVKHGDPMMKPAHKYLIIRSLGAPAVLLSLAMQGIFRGFKDTKTPLYATVIGDVSNIILDPILIFVCGMGVSGAAIAHVISQYLMSFILLWRLMKKIDLMPPSIKDMQFKKFVGNGVLLLARVIAVTFCVTLGASMAARLGATPMAAFQICLQVWMTSSLLADGLAVAGQAILATAFAEKDYKKASAAASRVLQMGFVLGVGLALFVGLGLRFGAVVFTKDIRVLHLIAVGIPFVAATQPINVLAFVFDGINFGASDFAYTAYSMVIVAIASIASLFFLSKSNGFVGIWVALTIYMALRALAGIWRMGTGTGPWRFLKTSSIN